MNTNDHTTNHEPSNKNNSTGPRTEEGKAKSRMNAFKTGLTGRVLVVSDWDKEAWKTFRRKALDHFQPKNWEEESLVDSIIQNEWRLQQWRINECNRRNIEFEKLVRKINRQCEPANEALAHAIAQEQLVDFIEKTSRYESRLARDVARAKKRLDEIQARRKSEAAAELELAMKCRAYAKSRNNYAWTPEEDGFVLSIAEIKQFTRRYQAQNRFQTLTQAA